jgi:hypothetical protein
MWIDPIVEELHRIREAHAARFGNDLQAIVADLRELEAVWRAAKIDPAPALATNPAVVLQGSVGAARTPDRTTRVPRESHKAAAPTAPPARPYPT